MSHLLVHPEKFVDINQHKRRILLRFGSEIGLQDFLAARAV